MSRAALRKMEFFSGGDELALMPHIHRGNCSGGACEHLPTQVLDRAPPPRTSFQLAAKTRPLKARAAMALGNLALAAGLRTKNVSNCPINAVRCDQIFMPCRRAHSPRSRSLPNWPN